MHWIARLIVNPISGMFTDKPKITCAYRLNWLVRVHEEKCNGFIGKYDNTADQAVKNV